MTAEATGGPVAARSIWLVLTPSGRDAGLTLDRDHAIRRGTATGGLVAELVVIADFRAPAA